MSEVESNETLLCQYLKNGDEEAYYKLYENNLDLVHSIVNKLYKGPEEKRKEFCEEYNSVGYIGLANAIRTFDSSKIGKIKFSTYAYICIKNAVYSEIRTSESSIKTISFETPINDDEDLTLGDTIASDDNVETAVIEDQYGMYKKNKIDEVLLQFNAKERQIIELHYGLNGNEQHSQTEIANILGCSRNFVSVSLAKTKKKLVVLLKEFRNDYSSKDKVEEENEEIDDEGKALTQKMNFIFYDFFKGKSKKEVDDSLNGLLAPKDKRLIEMYYGLNGSVCLDYDEIARRLYVSVDVIDRRIETAMLILKDSLKKQSDMDRGNLYTQLVETYGEQIVDKCMSKLNDESREIFALYFGVNCEKMDLMDISRKYNITYNSAYTKIRQAIDKIKKMTEDYTGGNFYNKFPGFKKEEIDGVLDSFDKESKELICMAYGLNGREKQTQRKLAQRFNTTATSINVNINKIVRIMKNSLVRLRVEGSNKSNFYKHFEGYNEKQIISALSKLDSMSLEIINSYYRLDENAIALDEVLKKYAHRGIDVVSYEKKIIGKIKDILENRNNYISRKERIIKEKSALFEEHTKNCKNVKEAFETLNEKDKKLIALYYGLDGKNIMGIDELARYAQMNTRELQRYIDKIIFNLNNYTPRGIR